MKRSELKEAIKAEIKSVLSEEITEAKFIKFKGDSDDNKMEVEAEREMNTPDGELKVYTVKTDDGVQSYTADQVELVEEDLNEGKRGVVVDPDEIKRHLDQFYGGNIDGNDLANAIEEILSDMMKRSVSFSDIREGTWSVGTKEQIGNFIKDMGKIKNHYYDIVGDDEVYNGLDSAVSRAEEMLGMVAENKSDLREKEMTDAEKKKEADKEAKKEKDFANKQKAVDKLKKELADNKDELVKIAKISRNERTKAQQDLLNDMAEKTKELKKLKRVEI